jgi:ribonuclease P protein component
MQVRRSGKIYAHPFLTLHVGSTNEQQTRIAVIAGKMVGNAVMRNKVKRRMRAIIDGYFDEMQGANDVVFVLKRKFLTCEFSDANQAVGQLLEKAGLVDLNNGHGQ